MNSKIVSIDELRRALEKLQQAQSAKPSRKFVVSTAHERARATMRGFLGCLEGEVRSALHARLYTSPQPFKATKVPLQVDYHNHGIWLVVEALAAGATVELHPQEQCPMHTMQSHAERIETAWPGAVANARRALMTEPYICLHFPQETT